MAKKLGSTFIPQNTPDTPFNTMNRKKNDRMEMSGVAMADTIQGIQAKNARMWQIIALACLCCLFLQIPIEIHALNLPKTVPVIVTVNEEGKANYVGKVDKSMYGKESIPEIGKIYQIKRLIDLMNIWVIDRDAQRNYVTESQSLVQEGAVDQLDTFYRENNPYDDFGTRIQSVTIEEPLRQSDSVYVVYFTRTTKTVSGYVIREERFSMLVTIKYFQPTPENPLGIYITNFDIKNA